MFSPGGLLECIIYAAKKIIDCVFVPNHTKAIAEIIQGIAGGKFPTAEQMQAIKQLARFNSAGMRLKLIRQKKSSA